MKRFLCFLFILLLSGTLLGGVDVEAQKFGKEGSKGIFEDGKDQNPSEGDDAIVVDMAKEASETARKRTKGEDDTWSTDEKGTKALRVVIEAIRNYFKPFFIIVGMFMIVGAGVGLIIGRGGEEENWKQKIRETLWVGLGFFIITASIFMVDSVFFGDEGQWFGVEQGDGEFKDFGNRGYDEIRGVVDFMTSLAIAAGVLLTIFSAIQLILAGENEEQMGKMKKRITWGIIGSLVMYLAKEFLIDSYFFPNVREDPQGIDSPPKYQEVIGDMIQWLGFGLSFVALLAVVALLVAAIYMIVHFGDEERVTKAKNIIKWCVIGMVLAFSAWTIVYFFANPVHQGTLG